jgi:ABC-2 type transport system ATP-binding protein
MTANSIVVEVESLEKRFGSFVAVDHITFQVKAGQIFGFLGPNGSGKSTTIRMLCAILMPTSGKARVLGFDVIREPDRIKENIGYMSQRFSLYDDLTVRENIRFYSGLYRIPREKQEERARWVIAMAGLREREDSLTRELAGGWKQRLALGCAILHDPPILFLDEPTSGVDPLSRRNFWQLIQSLSERGVTVFVTTHYMEEAEYCDTLALIYRGRIIAQGSSGTLKRETMPEDVYELDCGEPMAAMEILKSVNGIREIALYGKLLHLMVQKDFPVIEEVNKVLASRGILVKEFSRTLPSLEDVFVALVKEDDRKNDHCKLNEIVQSPKTCHCEERGDEAIP